MIPNDPFDLKTGFEREKQILLRLEDLLEVSGQVGKVLNHDLKTPLAVIQGATDLISASSGKLSEEQVARLLKAIRTGVAQIQDLISNSVPERLWEMSKPSEVDLRRLARDTAPDLPVSGTGSLSTHHADLVTQLLQTALASGEALHISEEASWVVLSVPGTTLKDSETKVHLVHMLGGEVEGTLIRLPKEPVRPKQAGDPSAL